MYWGKAQEISYSKSGVAGLWTVLNSINDVKCNKSNIRKKREEVLVKSITVS